jgi:hypothetical protein
MSGCNSVKTLKRSASGSSFHPTFNDEAADIILSSNDGTLFRMPSVILRTTSGLLRLFLADSASSKTTVQDAMPDDGNPSLNDHDCNPPTEVITLPFPSTSVDRVLLMLSAQPIEPWSSFDELEAAIDVIDYLDTPGPLSVIRASCFMPVFLAEPVRLYGLGVRFGWEDVVQRAAELTLTLNLFPSNETSQADATKLEDQLTHLPAPALYELLKLHRRRRDKFREFVYSTTLFSVGNAVQIHCSACGVEINNSFWRELRSRLVWEMDQNPSGESILALEMEESEECSRCWKAKCGGCGMSYYNRLETMKNIRDCLKQLPIKI